ncbi:MAG: archease [Candidatus Stahlbacteria bacterium]|nr:MAG: archease [Candidatus Stahlbacteria bacterium]
MNESVWEALEHTSDLELLIRGASEEELFANAAEALLAQIVEPESVGESEQRRIEARSESVEERFLDWLRELLYCVITQGFLVHHAEGVRLSEEGDRYRLEAVVCGEMLDLGRHNLLHEVKTVTYQDFLYGKEGDLWRARVVFDV